MARYAVFDRQNRRRRLDVLEEERIMADAEAKDDVELRARVVEERCLENGIAHRFVATDENLLVVRQADLFLGHCSRLADDRDRLEAMASEYLVDDCGLFRETAAEGQAEPPITHLMGELADLEHARLDWVHGIGLPIPARVALPLLN